MLVFVHINKTAGSTLRSILRSSYGSRHCDVEPWHGAWTDPPFSAGDLRRVRRLFPSLASIAGHRVTGYADLGEACADLHYVTVLREPQKLCASRFQYRLDHRHRYDLSFDRWIEEDWVRNAQTQRIAGVPDAHEAIRIIEDKQMFVGLTERFDESMVLLRSLRADDLDISYAPVNVAKRNNVAADLLSDARTRAMLAEANEADLELYRYVVDELYPRLRRAYGPSLDGAVEAYRGAQRARFHRGNVFRFRMKQHLVHKPMLRLYRGSGTGPAVERFLARPRPGAVAEIRRGTGAS